MIWSLIILTGFLAAWLTITRNLRDAPARRFALAGLAIALLLPALQLAFQISGIGWHSPSTAPTTGATAQYAWVIDALFGIWIFGSAISLGWLISHLLSVRRLLRSASRPDEMTLQQLAEISEEHDLDFATRLQVTHALASPCVVGFFRPIILVPATSRFWNADTWRCVLAHETKHLTGRDTLWRLAAAILRCIWWFHPLVHLLTKRAESACEEVCDAAVLTRGIAPHSYAKCLIDIADDAFSPTLAIAAFASPRGTVLNQRITRILTNDQTKSSSKVAFILALVVLGSSIVVAAKHQNAPAPNPPDPQNSEAILRLNANPFPAE